MDFKQLFYDLTGFGSITDNSFDFTSESVSSGHPDKLADYISDSILDYFLKHDPESRVACETFLPNQDIKIGGEITSKHPYTEDDIKQIVLGALEKIGYTKGAYTKDSITFENLINIQSPDISQGVDADSETLTGAGDQGIMFGYACNETPELMPAALQYAQTLVRKLTERRQSSDKNDPYSLLMPDAKAQVSLRYENGKIAGITHVVLSTQHAKELSTKEIHPMIKEFIGETLPSGLLNDDTEYHINPTGNFVIGGPVGDAGLTGRKIIVDTYGGAAPHGGGAFSGKDPTKVDRSAAYMARYIAKNVVAAGLADKCTIQLSYAIGVPKALSIKVDTDGTANVHERILQEAIQENFDTSPGGIIQELELRKPIYAATAAFGHFGRAPREDGHFSWEKTDKADALKETVNRIKQERRQEAWKKINPLRLLTA